MEVILHLSTPEGHSVNDFISREEFTLHTTPPYTMPWLSLAGSTEEPSWLLCWTCRQHSAWSSVLASEWELLGMYWRDKYYVETCLPFSVRSAPSIFDNFARALHWILEHNYGTTLLHYLDDFLLLGPPGLPTCQDSMSTMLQVCQELGMPVAMEKSEGPATCLTFLGIELDSSLQQLRLPLTKLQDITSLTKSWLGKRSSTKRELLSLIGKLAFAAKVVPAGRLFLHRLIHLSITVRRLHHLIRLNTDARADVVWWDRFVHYFHTHTHPCTHTYTYMYLYALRDLGLDTCCQLRSHPF